MLNRVYTTTLNCLEFERSRSLWIKWNVKVRLNSLDIIHASVRRFSNVWFVSGSDTVSTFDFRELRDFRVSHRLEKYLNLEALFEKSLKIKSALKRTGKSLKSLEKSLNSTIFCRTKHC